MSAGFLRMGKFVRMIPHSVMMGFVNGLAIVIFISQLGMFKSQGVWMQGDQLYIMIGLVGLTMGIMILFPQVTKKIPAALTAILFVTACVIFGDLETGTVKIFYRFQWGSGY